MTKHLLILIIGLAIVVRITTALMLGNKIEYLPAIADQISYHSLATRVLDGHGFTFDADWWPATKAGQPTAHWSYLYTLYLSGVYTIFGKNLLAARLIQAILSGLLMPWLAYRITRRVFDQKFIPNASLSPRFSRFKTLNIFWQESQQVIPLIVAAWVALYGYFVYFAAALMTETFYMIGILWTLDCSLRIGLRQPSFTSPYSNPAEQRKIYPFLSWIELGAAISITAMLRQVFLLTVPFLFLWLWYAIYIHEHEIIPSIGCAFKTATRKFIQGGFFTSLVMIVLIAPITIFNYHQFRRFVLLNTNAGYAFYWANHPIYGNDYVPLLTDDMPTYRELLPKEVLWMDEAALDQELLRRGLGFVSADPMRYLNLIPDRIPAYFVFWPLASSGLISNFTRVLSFGFALPFILAGIFLWIGDNRRRQVKMLPGVLLLLFILIYTMIHLLSWAGIRYRLPVDIVALIFAGRGLYSLGQAMLFKK